jgi:hypothetical protein
MSLRSKALSWTAKKFRTRICYSIELRSLRPIGGLMLFLWCPELELKNLCEG